MPIIGNFLVGGGDGNGLTLAAVTNIQTIAAGSRVYIKWTDPDDLVVEDSTLATWKGTILVRKAGSTPVSRRDGVHVLDSKERNAYQDTYFCDSGLTNGETYYYKFFPYTTQGAYTNDPADEFNDTPEAVPVGDVSIVSVASSGNGKLAIKWADPEATVIQDGATLATWWKTVVVVKEGDYATDPEDADAVYRQAITTHNQYVNTPLIVSGLTNGTTYYVSLFPVSTEGAVNANVANRAMGIPNRFVIDTVPSQTGTLTYTGSSQSPSWDGYDPNKMTIGNQTAGTNAGTYVAQFTPKDDYCWADGSVTAKNVSWVIGKKTGTLAVNPTSVTLDNNHLNATLTIDGEYDGHISVVITRGANIMTVKMSGSVIVVTNKNKTAGSGTITVTCGVGTNYTAPSKASVLVTANFIPIYGVEWDGTSTTKWSRTDASAEFINPNPAVNNGTGSSPFDTLQPWAGMVRVTDAEAGELVAIPKFYYKWTKSGKKLKLQVTNEKVSGFFTSPAHVDRGDGNGERDIVYVGRYHCGRDDYKSATGVYQAYMTTRSRCRRYIHDLGATIWQFDYAMRLTIQILYLVEFADWDSQNVIGQGGSTSGSAWDKNGMTDAMQYHTGTAAASRDDYGPTQYRNIEGLWDNVYDWMDGCYSNVDGLSVILDPSQFSDDSNGTNIGNPPSGQPDAFNVVENSGVQWLIPSEVWTGSSHSPTYTTDLWWFKDPCLYCGGYYHKSPSDGLFCVEGGEISQKLGSIGCRLQKLPQVSMSETTI